MEGKVAFPWRTRSTWTTSAHQQHVYPAPALFTGSISLRGTFHSHVIWLTGLSLTSFVIFLNARVKQMNVKSGRQWKLYMCFKKGFKSRNDKRHSRWHLWVCHLSAHDSNMEACSYRGEDKKKKKKKKTLHNCFKFHVQPRQPLTEGSCNKSLPMWPQAQYDFPLGE